MLFRSKAKSFFKLNVPKELHNVAVRILSELMIPNLIYSPELSDQYKILAQKSISKTEGIVRKGEIIVTKGQKVTKEVLQKVISYQKSRYLESPPKFSLFVFLGSIGHSFVVYSILLFYLYFIRKRIFHDNFQFAILSSLLILTAFGSWLTIQIPSKLPIEYFVFLPALSMLAAIVFDSRTAFYSTITMSLMLAGIRGNDYDAGTAMLIAGTIAAYTVRDIQSRTQIFKSMFFIMIGFSIPIISFGLERSADFSQVITRLLIALLNSAISPLLTFGLLFLMERFSKITTDLKLQEYNNLNHPLLVKLNELAPGTYQHTLSMAILAEKCAAAIGANALLAKVGSYFHDIGKMAKPEYFIENQLDMNNKHDSITPKKSVEAIKHHVLEGIKLAKEYKIPQRIVDFIPMHHGTSLIKHFYAKALEEADGKHVNEKDFRYPGPKPNNKETSIVMICDSAEAVSRLVKDKDQLEQAIEKIIQEKLLDGQFDDSNLSFKELNVIKDTCIKNLLGVSHQRVEYKEIPKKS